MAKFCTKCGKKLKEGEKCSCEETVVVQANDFSSLFKQLIENIKGIIVKPIDTIKNSKEDDKFILSLITVAIYGIIIGLFVMGVTKALYSSIASIFTLGMSDYTSLFDTSYELEIPYFKMFIIGFICSIATIFLMALISYVISAKILKNKTSYKSIFNVFATSSNILIITLVIATICTFINIKLALAVYLAGGLLNSYYNVKAIEISTDTDENNLGYILMPAALIAPFVVTYIISKIVF